MLFLLIMLWAEYYDGDSDDSYVSSSRRYSDDETDTYAKKSYSYSTSKSEKRYATDGIPGDLQDEVLEIFSEETVRNILELPDAVETLRQWSVTKLSFSSHDSSTKREHAISRAIQDLCSIAIKKDRYFCENKRTLVRRIVEDTLYEKETDAIKQLLQFSKSTIQDDEKRLNALEKEARDIKEREPKIKRQMHADYNRISQEEQLLDEKIQTLEAKLKQPYKDENKKGYDQQTLAYLKDDKQLLLDDSKHVQHSLDKQARKFKEIKKEEYTLRDDLEKIKDMPKEISRALKKREDKKADLKKAWDKVNRHFSKLEENKKKDKNREEEETRKRAEQRAKETASEEKEQAQELKTIEGLEGETSDKEASKESASLLKTLGGFLNMG